MKIENIPFYNSDFIENRSNQLLNLFSPNYFEFIKPTPLLKIVEYLKVNYNIEFNLEITLGFSQTNSRILGACNPSKRVIYIDSSLKNDIQKFNFTLAHELGHLSLHRKIKIVREFKDEIEEPETVRDSYLSGKRLSTDSEWIEWQANYYASCLLLPSDIFISKLFLIKKELGLREGLVFIDNQSCNQISFSQIINSLSCYFNVSKSAVQYRLFNLKLVNDKRKSHIRDYLQD